MSPNDAPSYFGCASVEPPAVGGSCANSCGGMSLTPGAVCYCDDACIELEDCCFDALEYCPIEPPAPATDTCAGQCDGSSLDGSCYCDEACTELGDCCSDKTDYCPTEPPVVVGTCDGSCGGLSLTAGASCFCDFACIGFGDCCDDAPAFCPAETGTCAVSCGGQSATDGATCYCDEYCVEYGDCCFDATTTCPSVVKGFRDGGRKKAKTAGGRGVNAARSGRNNMQK
jgi:hypothetical protein